ncbi:MAG: hypothetical protein HY906_15475 [Deltaproteobacteria bacterium]|nr:hypothetical protein [Deltaproteobacteria bacterium]
MWRSLAALVLVPLVILVLLLSGCGLGSIVQAGGGHGGGGGSSGDGGTVAGDGGLPLNPTPDAGEPAMEVPLTPTSGDSSGVKLDPNGDLVLDAEATTITLSYIWVANSPDNTVSKINTKTGVEEGRYRTGPGTSDPSRTTVGLTGDVVVANRGGSSAVRIHADKATCPDKNGNGQIETSTGPGNVLPWGQDECVLWSHEFPAGALARAAAFDYSFGPDGEASSSVWIGLYSLEKVVRLDSQTGAQLAEVSIPGHHPYGMAFDGNGNLWVQGGNLVRIDTATLQWESIAAPGCQYGITTDQDGNVWLGGGACVARYQPGPRTWTSLSVGTDNYGGIAADGAGSIWAAGRDYGAIRIDAATLVMRPGAPTAGGCKGMAVDFEHNIWCISQTASTAYRIDPNTLAVQGFPTGRNPYTYSDMTGFQLQNVAPPLGFYRPILKGCGPQQQWLQLVWDAVTGPGMFVRFRARTANSETDLAARPWVSVARQPSDASPADLKAILEAATPGSSQATYLQLEITLGAEVSGTTPTLKSVSVRSTCPID